MMLLAYLCTEKDTTIFALDQAALEHLTLQERLYGVPLTDLEGIQKVSKNPEATLISALNTWTLSVMNCDFFHAVSREVGLRQSCDK